METKVSDYHTCNCYPTSRDLDLIQTLKDGVEIYSCGCGVLYVEREMDDKVILYEIWDHEAKVMCEWNDEEFARHLMTKMGANNFPNHFVCYACEKPLKVDEKVIAEHDVCTNCEHLLKKCDRCEGLVLEGELSPCGGYCSCCQTGTEPQGGLWRESSDVLH